jgi:pimeloyl-ACP methyl ester carboxylesterase
MVELGNGQRVYVRETTTQLPGAAGLVPPLSAEAEPVGPSRVLCVHGMTGDATNWTDFMADLAPDFDCTAVDLPGSGFSPPPRSTRGYSITAQAATVIKLIEALNTGPVHLVGNSMGGCVTLRVSARRPDLVKTLTLVSAALPDRRPHRSTVHFPVLAVPVLGERLVRKFGRIPPENRMAGVIQTCYYDPTAVHPVRFALAAEELRRRDGLGYDAASIVHAARTLVAETFRPHRFSLWHAATRVTAPTLVLFGSHDRLVSPLLAETAQRAFRNATIQVMPQTGHIAQMERPALVASMFREMVERTQDLGNEAALSAPGMAPGSQGMPDSPTRLPLTD